MNRGTCNRKRKGFTLMELIVAIVILGILGGIMIVSAREVSDTAEANAIIQNLTVLRNATFAWYLDNIEEASKPDFNFGKINKKDIMPYVKKMSNDDLNFISFDLEYKKNKAGDDADKEWWIVYTLGKDTGDWMLGTGIRAKLAARAKTLRLYKGDGSLWEQQQDYYGEKEYTGKNTQKDTERVAIKVFE